MKKLVTNPWSSAAATGERKLVLSADGKISMIEERNPVCLFWSYDDGQAHDPELLLDVRWDNSSSGSGAVPFWQITAVTKKLNVASSNDLFTNTRIFPYISYAETRELRVITYGAARDISFWVFGKLIRKHVPTHTEEVRWIFIATVEGTAISGTSDMEVRVNGEYRGIWPRN